MGFSVPDTWLAEILFFNAGFGMRSHLDWCLDFYSSKCLGMDHDVDEIFGPI